jgi:beta-lactamase regulating signal transducer with metallopeptidase domain
VNEVLFPTVGAALIVILVLPLCAVLSRVLLALCDGLSGRVGRYPGLGYLLLLVPSLVPIAWTLSAGLHQAETGRAVLACLLRHDLEEACVEPLLFVTLLGALIAFRLRPWLATYRRASRLTPTSDPAAVARMARLVETHPALRELEQRWIVSEGSVNGTATVGLWRPLVAVDAAFVSRCDDEMLLGALCHELEHLRGRDPLRYALLSLSMRLNPFGERLLRRDAAAWIFRREMECDRMAVLGGAEAFGLARALLCASAPTMPAIAHIRGGTSSRLRLRVELLLAYAEAPPRERVRMASLASLIALAASLLLALALPHAGKTGPLDLLHTSVELAARALLH